MVKIGIIRCWEQSKNCAGYNCFPAIRDKSGEFKKYDNIDIIGFESCGGCGRNEADKITERALRLKEKGAEVIHLANCIISACPWKKLYLNTLKEQVGLPIVEKTHGYT